MARRIILIIPREMNRIITNMIVQSISPSLREKLIMMLNSRKLELLVK